MSNNDLFTFKTVQQVHTVIIALRVVALESVLIHNKTLLLADLIQVSPVCGEAVCSLLPQLTQSVCA